LGRFETLPRPSARSPAWHLAQIPPADLDIPIIGQLALPEFSLGDPLEAGSLEVVGFEAPLGVGRLDELLT